MMSYSKKNLLCIEESLQTALAVIYVLCLEEPKPLNVIDLTPEEQRISDKMNKTGEDNGHTHQE
jgi:hypothetical protein